MRATRHLLRKAVPPPPPKVSITINNQPLEVRANASILQVRSRTLLLCVRRAGFLCLVWQCVSY
jgi:hypothetical protein